MNEKFPEYKGLDLPKVAEEILVHSSLLEKG